MDITERKRAEEALLVTKILLEKTFSSLEEVVLVIDPTTRTIIQCNEAMERIFGYNKKEVIGLNTEFLHVDRHMYEIFGERLFPVLDRDGVFKSEYQVKRKDGTLFFTENTITEIRDYSGNRTGIVSVIRDITERKFAEEAIKESEMFYRTIIENSKDMIWTLDRECNFLFFNKRSEEISGYNLEELQGKNLASIIKEDELSSINELFHETLEGVPQQFEVSVKRKDGCILMLSVNTAPIYSKREIVGTVSFGRDITEDKKIEKILLENERLISINKARSEFLTIMSHELRTPLTSIIAFSILLKERIHGKLNKKQEAYVETIHTSGLNLLDLINNTLDLAKIEAGKMEIVIEDISIPDILNETMDLIKGKAESHNILLKTDIDLSLDHMKADRQKVKQILFNLISNAIKFMKEEGGIVTISAKKDSEMAKISVSDTGIGIKTEDLPKLFQRFEQLDSGISRKYGGSGLGLAITRQLVELHGGKIIVESKYGKGSTFTILIPLEAKK